MKSTLMSFTNADSASPLVMKAAPVTMATRQLHLLLIIPDTGPITNKTVNWLRLRNLKQLLNLKYF